jgi:hypothetical protein
MIKTFANCSDNILISEIMRLLVIDGLLHTGIFHDLFADLLRSCPVFVLSASVF